MAERWRTRVGVGILATLALGVGAWFLAVETSLFHLRAVDVRGGVSLDARDVARLAGLGRETNVLTLSTRRVERALLGSPRVRAARVSRSLPGTLVVRLEERRPVASVRADDGRVGLVASDGTVLAEVHRPRPRLPLVTSVRSLPEAGERLSHGRGRIRVLASLQPGVRRRVAAIRAGAGGMELTLRGGGRVRYGTVESEPVKRDALGAMLRWADRRGVDIAYIDLRAPSSPALMPASGGEPPGHSSVG